MHTTVLKCLSVQLILHLPLHFYVLCVCGMRRADHLPIIKKKPGEALLKIVTANDAKKITIFFNQSQILSLLEPIAEVFS